MLAPGKGRTILGSAYHQQLYLLAREYLREACKDASLDHEVLLLAGAMSLVGGIPNAKGQWLQGEPVLREAINNLPAV